MPSFILMAERNCTLVVPAGTVTPTAAESQVVPLSEYSMAAPLGVLCVSVPTTAKAAPVPALASVGVKLIGRAEVWLRLTVTTA